MTGVLTRIAICYGIVSLIALYMNHRYIPSLTLVLFVLYSILLYFGNGYLCDESNLLGYIDRTLLGAKHLYLKSPIDPEGLTSTLPAIAHTLIGFYCGKIIVQPKNIDQKVMQLFLIGFILIGLGWLLGFVFPLNKRIWSPSFAILTCGGAASLLAMLLYFIDIKGRDSWSLFFKVFGVNPLFLYVMSELLSIIFSNFGIKGFVYESIYLTIGEPYISSALYAILFTLLLSIAGYYLYKKRIYIKIG